MSRSNFGHRASRRRGRIPSAPAGRTRTKRHDGTATMRRKLLDLLDSTSGLRESPRWHPERDVLFHQLQAFELARHHSEDRGLWAAALLHDVGKAVCFKGHAEWGADLLEGVVSPRVVWLVRHHLDLLESPHRTRRRWRQKRELHDLTLLRRWDVAARRPEATISRPELAVAALLAGEGAMVLDPTAGEPASLEINEAQEYWP